MVPQHGVLGLIGYVRDLVDTMKPLSRHCGAIGSRDARLHCEHVGCGTKPYICSYKSMEIRHGCVLRAPCSAETQCRNSYIRNTPDGGLVCLQMRHHATQRKRAGRCRNGANLTISGHCEPISNVHQRPPWCRSMVFSGSLVTYET
jgi:hypothetical protein